MRFKPTDNYYVENNDTVSRYLNEIRNTPLLTANDEVELIIKAQNGDKEARDTLIIANQRFVYAVAKRFATTDKIMDLVNEANIGMITAIDLFDPTRGMRFLTYAVWYIRREIGAYITRKEHIVRRSNDMKTSYFLEKIKNKFFCENGRFPTSDEISDILFTEYDKSIKNCDAYDIVIERINGEINKEHDTFEEHPDFTSATSSENQYEEEIDNESYRDLVAKYMSVLCERDRDIIKMSFGIDCGGVEYDLDSISEKLGVSKERVRQIKNSAIKKMQAAIPAINRMYK